MLMQAPHSQRRPVLLFAATHDLLLAPGAPRHPLARFYRSVVDEADWRDDVEHAMPLFVDFCRVHRDALATLLAQRTTQTNEVGRCAGLRLALSTLARDRPVALIDIGCSAGLNLLVDRYRYAYRRPDGSTDVTGPDSEVVLSSTITKGEWPLPRDLALPPIVQRLGVDRAPLDVRDARDARWLRACVWPSDVERHRRLDAAMAMARATPRRAGRGRRQRSTRGPAGRGRSIRTTPSSSTRGVVSYFDRNARRRFAEAARSMVVGRDGAWISAEGPGIVPGLVPAALPDDASLASREATVWHVTTAARRCSGRSLHRPQPPARSLDRVAGSDRTRLMRMQRSTRARPTSTRTLRSTRC